MKQRIITIMGGSGFLGSYIVKELAKTGAGLRIVSRYPDEALHLKTAGSVGQIVLARGDITREVDIKRAVEDAEVVINLVGVLSQHGRQRFSTLHAQAPEQIAKLAKAAGCKTFIHFSALGVENGGKSYYSRTKLTGEKAVLAAFPEAMIIRPSVVFGPEDNFFNKFARLACDLPFLPVIGDGKTRFQPVYAGDIARAVKRILENDYADYKGKVFELGGREIWTLSKIVSYTRQQMGINKPRIHIPFSIASIVAACLELLPNPSLSRDQVELLKTDNILPPLQAPSGIYTLDSLGIEASTIDAVVPYYLSRYRKDSAIHTSTYGSAT